MSVWKKAAKAHQKTHRERHQPEARQELGLLPKKKDYIRRAQDYNEKKATLKLLRKRALNRNPDEFYHHMINSKTENGRHFEKETEDEDSPVQVKLMRTQDLKYIVTKRTQELKKIEKLQAQLHLTSVEFQPENKHIYFGGKPKNVSVKQESLDIDIEELKEATKNKTKSYLELAKRIDRERELAIIQQKIEVKRHVENKTVLKPKKVKKGNRQQAPIYVWKYERKK